MRKPLSSDQKWFLRPYFPLIGGIFVLKSGLRFLFRALEGIKFVVKQTYSLCCTPLLTCPLTRSGDYWRVSSKLGEEEEDWCFLRAEVGEEDQLVPPVNGWQFKERRQFKELWGGTKWSSDGTLECSREVSEPCTKIVVELHGKAKKKQSSCDGVYLPVEGVVVRGRPVGSDDDNWFVNRTVKNLH